MPEESAPKTGFPEDVWDGDECLTLGVEAVDELSDLDEVGVGEDFEDLVDGAFRNKQASEEVVALILIARLKVGDEPGDVE